MSEQPTHHATAAVDDPGLAPGATPGGVARRATDRDAVELLGLVAYTELATFGRLASDAAHAPTLHQRLVLSRQAATMLDRQDRVLAHLAELGTDPEAEMAAFDGIFDDFNERTRPSTWWEGILKGYVGHGVADDFCRLAADGLDGPSREIVLGILSDGVDAERSASVLAEAATGDPVLASRLALWGRRLVGEALGLVQNLLAQRPGLGRLVVDSTEVSAGLAGGSGIAAPADLGTEGGTEMQAWVFSQLTAEHTRRMGRLGLAA
ncbi:ferritin-like fold-containing protein [Oerskovia flava]|uniref:ferritin-like fold-containing protein n=1 Tax=Oerskovia flava TaxID=2986422 RepID=UPI0022407B8E|nr:ferritin-like fold-containing protein [Oerskovia sp. JB1-3-2]